jgi:hypothetical protein
MRLLGFHTFILLKKQDQEGTNAFRGSDLDLEDVKYALAVIDQRALPEHGLGVCGFGACTKLAYELFFGN